MRRAIDEALSRIPALPTKARRLRIMRRWIHEESIGAPAFLFMAWAMAGVAASLLLWAGITHDWLRAVLLLIAAAAIRARRAFARFGAATPMDGKDMAVHLGRKQRWAELAQEAVILMGAGLCGYGSGFWLGPVLGVLAAALLIGQGVVMARQGELVSAPKPDPAMSVALFAVIATVEPLWRWRGQLIVIGLFAVCVVMAWQVYGRLRRPPSRLP
jgi:hypothetical protein